MGRLEEAAFCIALSLPFAADVPDAHAADPVPATTKQTEEGVRAVLAAEQKSVWELPDGEIPLGTSLTIPFQNGEKKETLTMRYSADGLSLTINGKEYYTNVRGVALTYTVTITKVEKTGATLVVHGKAVGMQGSSEWTPDTFQQHAQNLQNGRKVGIKMQTPLGTKNGALVPKGQR